MHLSKLTVVNYKNIPSVDIALSEKINCFLGDNGAGKTNLIDAIYYLSFCKSFFHSVEQQNVMHNESFFMIQGAYQREEKDEQISSGYKVGGKKQFKRNQKKYKKFSEHIGLIPLVIITPSDSNLMMGGSDERRKFLDGVISQYDKDYLFHLVRYNKVLLQRNTLLKQFAENNQFDETTLGIFDEQLVKFGSVVYQKRKSFLESFIPVFQKYYIFLSSEKEQVDLIYHSQLHDNNYELLIAHNQNKDRVIQNTGVGVHKDDHILNLGDFPIKTFGSQGKQKKYLISLKLAQYEYLKKISGLKPILLLDDIFDKLDKKRVGKIIELVNQDSFGQIFLSDTNREHLDDILQEVNVKHKIFFITEGEITE